MRAEDLFQRFQQTREPAHLGAVFDLVADDLFAVALHLCRDEAEADDLVQATFLIAIERAYRYDAARPLRPWLLGVLQQEAKARRRRARRVVDPQRLPVTPEPPPVQIVLAAEAADAGAGAIAKVPQPYRDVLELRLLQSLENGEVAARLSRSPGAVRTQLWRGLELLRQLLPKGLALALAAQLSLRPGLAAVKQKVMSAAGAKAAATGGGAVVLAGAIMQKVWIGAAAAAVLAAGWLAWPQRAADAALVDAPLSPPAAAAASDKQQPLQGERTDRTLLASPSAPAPPTITASVAPITVRALVVDSHGDPVADAEIAVYAAKPAVDEHGQPRQAYVRLPSPPLLRAHTDVAGNTSFRIDRESFVAARKDGLGISGDIRVAPEMRELCAELRLVLRPSLRITGTVLMADGSPARGASVDCFSFGERGWHLPPAAITGEDGRFAFELVAERAFTFGAHLGDQHAPAIQIGPDKEPADRDITLRFPGAFSVRGVLLDADGRPTAGSIRLLTQPGQRARGHHQAKANARGEFALLLTEGGSFEIFGGVAGQNVVHMPLLLDGDNPHRNVTLRLPPRIDAMIAGRAVDEHGIGCAGVKVAVGPLSEEPAWMLLGLSKLQPQYRHLTDTAADGSFRFVVPGNQGYRLSFGKALWVHGPEVMPPAENVLLIVRDADQQGFTIHGRVIAAATGRPVAQFRAFLVEHQTSGGSSDSAIANGKDGTFEAGPYPIGRRYSVRVEADGFGDADLGPFDATVRCEQLTARMQALGSVLVTVLRADGMPAVKAHVGLDRQGSHPFEAAHQGDTDAEGRVRIANLTADSYTLYATAEVATAGKAQNELVVRPGQQTAVQVTLRR